MCWSTPFRLFVILRSFWLTGFWLAGFLLAGFWTGNALAQDVPLPAQSPDTPWPTQSWPMSDPVDLSEVLDPVFASRPSDGGLGLTRGIIVIQDGQVIAERYNDGVTSQTRHVSWSVAKSLTTTLVGRAVQTGLIASIDDPMPGAFSDGDPRAKISWRHWMQLLDGLDYRELDTDGMQNNDAVQMLYGPGRHDQIAYARDNFPALHSPGTQWNYSTATFHLVARALQSLLPGTCINASDDPKLCRADPEVMANWVRTVLFEPLGMDAIVEFDAAGSMLGGSSAYMSVRDYARFGLLILRDGVWEGKRLLPEGWVDLNRTNPGTPGSNVYGMGFWPSVELSDNPDSLHKPPFDAFHAGGREGQIVWIVPSRNIVIVRVGLMPDGSENWNRLFAFAQDLVAATPRD